MNSSVPVHYLLTPLLFLFGPFLFAGIIIRTKAVMAGRCGPPILQPFWDFLRLFKKESLISRAASMVSRVANPIILGSAITAALVVPGFGGKGLVSFPGDFLFFACTLAAGRFFLLLMAMDSGSGFQGMGASREACFAMIVEPSFTFLMAALACLGMAGNPAPLQATGLSLQSLVAAPAHVSSLNLAFALTAWAALFILLTIEGSRIPVDDPCTHLELTMIHEVMILDTSGPDLAMATYATNMRMLIISSFGSNLLISGLKGAGIALGLPWEYALFIGITAFTALFAGVVESSIARVRMTHVPQYLLFMIPLSVLVMAGAVMIRGGLLK